MKIVVTGMVGVDKKSYLQRVCQFAAKKGKEVVLCNVGDMMYAEAPDIPPGKILDIPMKRLNSLRRSVFKDIISKAKKAPNLIVNTHATFRWRHGLFPAVDFDQMRQLDADMYICLIDGVIALHSRLTDEHSVEHSLKDLIVWREEEIIGTEMLFKGVDESAKFYCFARGCEEQTTEAFYGLVFEQSRKKAYLSFPITHVADMEDVQEEIKGFRRLMKGFFTCFDPADLEESYLPHYAHKAAEQGSYFVEVSALGRNVRLDLPNIRPRLYAHRPVGYDNKLYPDVSRRPGGGLKRGGKRAPACPRGGKRGLRNLDIKTGPFGIRHPDGNESLQQTGRGGGLLQKERLCIKLATIEEKKLAGCIDHTLLSATATSEQIKQLCTEAKDYGFCTVSVNPRWIVLAAEQLHGSKVKVGGVVSLPLGADTTKIKAAQAKEAIFAGADEIDMVADLAAIIESNEGYLHNQLQVVLRVCRSMRPAVVLKVIIESAALTREQKIFVCQIADRCGVDFVKTSTGMNPAGGATVEDIKFMKETAPNCKIKAAGGIKTAKQAVEMLDAGAERIGTSSGVKIINEFRAGCL